MYNLKVYKQFIDFNKEELWLKEMARQGYRLTHAGLGYYNFDRMPDCSYDLIFKIDYRCFSNNEDFRDYCTMFEDSGWLHIAGGKRSGAQYFVKNRPDAGDDIFSDRLSRAGRYKRISLLWLSLVICYTIVFLMLLLNNTVDFNNLYLTPGLWEMRGWRFILHFLFESPFAFMRLSPYLIYFLIIVFYAYYTIKSYTLYKQEKLTGSNW